jgi:sigma-B regulation protein RsbU (phosphoserine phosphatase)
VPPLGIIPLQAGEDGIQDEIFKLNGGTLYIFTDGVVEGDLLNGNRLGVEGFMKIIVEHLDDPLATRIGSVVAHLQEHGGRRHDDITILGVEDMGIYEEGAACRTLT